MIKPFGVTGTIPEFDVVMIVLLKKSSEFLSYGNRLELVRVR